MNSLANKAKRLLVDSIKLKVIGGRGGHGLPQYGGIGGKGGDVYIKGSTKSKGLQSILKSSTDNIFVAQDGQSARRTRLMGESGRDLYISVPLGVTIEDIDKQYVGEINDVKDRVIVALGGRGGDKFNDNQGFAGQSRVLKLDLKMISDAVLVGFPNAGKSSILRAVSRASPRVAEYPFTTLKPNLGMIQFKDYRTIALADLPGLVEGAHKNLGLGHEFIKHMVRSKLLIYLIDINNIDLGPSYAARTPIEALCILNKEIELYDDTILDKPAILVINKMDSVANSEERYIQFRDSLRLLQENPESSTLEESLRPSRPMHFEKIMPVSAITGQNLDKFKEAVREMLDRFAECDRADSFSSYRELRSIENNRLLQ